MAGRNNKISGFKGPSLKGIPGLSTSFIDLIGQPSGPGSLKGALPSDGGLRPLGLSTGSPTKSLLFGSPSSSGSSSPTGGSTWSKLLNQTTSGGIGSLLGGGIAGGIGSLISGFESLFSGGSSEPPALVRYQLPASQDQVSYVGPSNTGPASVGSPVDASVSHGVYQSSNSGGALPFEYQSTQIAQAVKQALLNSSSLNDVIAEI